MHHRRHAINLRWALAEAIGVGGARATIDAALVELAAEHGVSHMLDRVVSRRDSTDGVEPTILRRLQADAGREQGLVLAGEAEASRVVQSLGERGIDVVALKGLVGNIELHRPRNWCRAPGDVDLLVRASDAPAVRDWVASEADLEPIERMPESFYDTHHHLQPFTRKGAKATPVEIHVRISGVTTGGVRIDHDGCWDRAVAFSALADGALRLDDVDQCLATAIHVDRDDAYWGRTRQLVDLFLWMDRCADRWDELWQRAEEWNAVSTVARALSVADAFLGPSEVRGPEKRNGSPVGLPNRWRQTLWLPMAVQAASGLAPPPLPPWYAASLIRALSHEPTWASVASRILDPLRHRLVRRRS